MAEPLRLPVPLRGKVAKTALDDQPPGTVIESRDVIPRDCKSQRSRLSVRPGFAAFGSQSNMAGLFTLGSAFDETGGIQLMGCTSSTLYRWTGAAWSSVGSITSSTSRTIHAASKGKQLFIACNDPYKYYDYDDDDNGTPDHTIATWDASSAGTIPPNCRIVSAWGERIVLLADPDNPHVVNFSRNDDPFDWDFTQEDTGSAVSAEIDEAATCGIPHNRDCFIVGTKSSMWIFRGNPSAANGILEKFSFNVGPINSSAWCKTADDFTYFVAHDGLYRMPPGCGSAPQPVSQDLVPAGLLGLDGTNSKAYLVYDEWLRAIHIYVEGTSASRWLYDIDGGGFWPITAPGSTILAAHRFGLADSATKSGALVATAGGVMRFDSATALGGSDLAYATMLFPLAPLGMKGVVQRGEFVFTSDTDDDTGIVELCGGRSAIAAAARTADRRRRATIDDIIDNHNKWPLARCGGQSMALTISQGSTSAYWSLDGMTLYAVPHGRERY